MKNDIHAYWICCLFILLCIINFTSQIISEILLRVSSSHLAIFTEITLDVVLSVSHNKTITENSLVYLL